MCSTLQSCKRLKSTNFADVPSRMIKTNHYFSMSKAFSCPSSIQRAWRNYHRTLMADMFPFNNDVPGERVRKNPFSSSGSETPSHTHSPLSDITADSHDGRPEDTYLWATLEARLREAEAYESRVQQTIESITQETDSSDGEGGCFWFSESDAEDAPTKYSFHRPSSDDFKLCFDNSDLAIRGETRSLGDGASVESVPVDCSSDRDGNGEASPLGARKVRSTRAWSPTLRRHLSC